jgi:hypothetical protein
MFAALIAEIAFTAKAITSGLAEVPNSGASLIAKL